MCGCVCKCLCVQIIVVSIYSNSDVINHSLGHGTCSCGECVCDKAPSGNAYRGEICDCYPDEDVCRMQPDDQVCKHLHSSVDNPLCGLDPSPYSHNCHLLSLFSPSCPEGTAFYIGVCALSVPSPSTPLSPPLSSPHHISPHPTHYPPLPTLPSPLCSPPLSSPPVLDTAPVCVDSVGVTPAVATVDSTVRTARREGYV